MSIFYRQHTPSSIITSESDLLFDSSSIGSRTILANTLVQGDILHILLEGYLVEVNNNRAEIRLLVNEIIQAQTPNLDRQNKISSNLLIEFYITISTIGSSGVAYLTGKYIYGMANQKDIGTTFINYTLNIDTTIDNTIKLMVKTGDNDISLQIYTAFLELL